MPKVTQRRASALASNRLRSMATQLKLDFNKHTPPSSALVQGVVNQINLCVADIAHHAYFEFDCLWSRVVQHIPCLPGDVRSHVYMSLAEMHLRNRDWSAATTRIVCRFLDELDLPDRARGAALASAVQKKPPASAPNASTRHRVVRKDRA